MLSGAVPQGPGHPCQTQGGIFEETADLEPSLRARRMKAAPADSSCPGPEALAALCPPQGLACFPQNEQTTTTEFLNLPLRWLSGLKLFLRLPVAILGMELSTCCFLTTPACWFIMEVGARLPSACGPHGSCLIPHASQVFSQQEHGKGAQS